MSIARNKDRSQLENILISVIIPAYNEEGSIRKVITAIRPVLPSASEIIVVNDGSQDKTLDEASSAGARVISHPYNMGNGASIKTGIRHSRGIVLIFLDADGQHDPSDIPRLLPHISNHHMVVGARSKGSETHVHRDLANYLYCKLASLVANFKIQDLTSGFRIMRREDALRFCDMLPNTFSYPTTSTLAFIRSGRSIKYVPIVTKKRVGKSKIKLLHDGFEFLIIIMKIAMTFSPLRVFIPISSFLFFLGIGRYLYTFWTIGRFTNMSHLLINSSIIIFMLGLIAEQIASLRFERGDRQFNIEDSERYKIFNDPNLPR